MRADGEGASRRSPESARPFSNGSGTRSPIHSPSFAKSNGHIKTDSNGSSYANGHPRPTGAYFGHDREEVTRIIIQGLMDLGYHTAARNLSKESGFELEGPEVAAFRSAVLSGDWPEAEALLFGTHPYDDGGGVGITDGGTSSGKMASNSSSTSWANSRQNGGLLLGEGANKNEMLFWMRQQKYLELLEERDLSQAVLVLRQELTPLHRDQRKLHILSSLMMCSSADDLRMQAQWDGASGQSRNLLLSALSKSISPSIMIPEQRLAILLDQVKDNWIQNCSYHNTAQPPSLYIDHTCEREDFPLEPIKDLTGHSDEVWFLAFSNDGTKLATAGKDCTVVIYETCSWKQVHVLQEHENGVCYVAWSPDDTKLITCTQTQDSSARLWDVQSGRRIFALSQLTYSVTSAAWAPDGESFVIGSHDVEDPLCVWNMQNQRVYQWKEDNLRVHDLSISPDGQRLVVLLESRILVYDFVTREKIAERVMDNVKTTSINISADSRQMLVSMNENTIKLMVIDTGEVIKSFEGHKQTNFIIRSAFGGADENFVVSGSEDSKIYIWRINGQLVEILDAHPTGCVNAVAWHPKNACLFASAGDDHKVRVWSNNRYYAESI